MDSQVGPYRILRLLDRGGQGSVYLGFDKRLHRRVAIKIYNFPEGRAARRKLLREARLVASMQSAKVVQIHDLITSDHHLAMVMEYVPGCNLEELLQQVRPSLASLVTLGTDIAGALALAKQQGIVHGDVKAGNILITEEGHAKLTDFGIARHDDTAMRVGLGGASPSAVAPEQYEGQGVDHRADLFALGVLLYRVMSGEHPFYRNDKLDEQLLLHTPHRALSEIVGGEVELPPALISLIDDLLQKDPQQRPRNTQRVRQVLRDVSRDIPMSSINSLLREAKPCFRLESPDDLPPLIPAGLAQQGRSALIRGDSKLSRLWQRFRGLRRYAQAAIALFLSAIIVAAFVLVGNNRTTAIAFEQPQIAIADVAGLPVEVDERWLLRQVREVVRKELGELFVIGEIGAGPITTLYSDSAAALLPTVPEQEFAVSFRCTQTFCIFIVSQEVEGARQTQQAVLLPDMPLPQIADIIRDTTRALYE